jgi:prepilin signal peptidase PulO-like enzyme (type II secretory pathway)
MVADYWTALAQAIAPFCVVANPLLPQAVWWLTALVFFLLTLTALVDAVTSTVPEGLIFIGMFSVAVVQAVNVSLAFAATHFLWGCGAICVVWFVNMLWREAFKEDAIGMGDATWTGLAVACFGFPPVLWAWGIGAWLGLFWLGAGRAVGLVYDRLYFAPFLLIGLITALWLMRFHGMAWVKFIIFSLANMIKMG